MRWFISSLYEYDSYALSFAQTGVFEFLGVKQASSVRYPYRDSSLYENIEKPWLLISWIVCHQERVGPINHYLLFLWFRQNQISDREIQSSQPGRARSRVRCRPFNFPRFDLNSMNELLQCVVAPDAIVEMSHLSWTQCCPHHATIVIISCGSIDTQSSKTRKYPQISRISNSANTTADDSAFVILRPHLPRIRNYSEFMSKVALPLLTTHR
jgi:hypothetical protein